VKQPRSFTIHVLVMKLLADHDSREGDHERLDVGELDGLAATLTPRLPCACAGLRSRGL